MENLHTLILDQESSSITAVDTPEVHPVLIVLSGSTSAELAICVYLDQQTRPDSVPHRVIVIDSLPYGHLVPRLEQVGYGRDLIETALPRSHYFELTNPFVEDFDFDAPLNRDWLRTIHEPSLRRIAARPNSPGCAGTPALGRSRVEGNEQDLRAFYEMHLQELTQIRPATLALREGVKVFFITTGRGGNGTGASAPAAAVLRSVLNGSIHFVCLMPCIFAGDDRSRANAYAMIREIQHHHRFGGGVPMKDGKLRKAPYDTVTLVFASNGAVTLKPVDAIAQETALVGAYLNPRTQSAHNSRHVDLTDIDPYDLDDKPMHVRVTTAVSVRTLYSGVQEYLATAWIHQEVYKQQERFEQWCAGSGLSPNEESVLGRFVEELKKELGLNPSALPELLDGRSAANSLRSTLEQVRVNLAAMKAEEIKSNIAGLPLHLKDGFAKFEPVWVERGRQLASSLPRKIVEYVTAKLGATPHLYEAALGQVQRFISEIAADAFKAAEREKAQRDEGGRQLGEALAGVQNASAILGVFKRDEVVRDAAQTALSCALSACIARVQQQTLEILGRALQSDLSASDVTGKPISLPGVIPALRDAQIKHLAEVRRRHSTLLTDLNRRLEALGFAISRRSPVFQRALLFDGVTREKLDQIATEIREKITEAPAVLKMFECKQDISQTVDDLLPLLPLYAESCKNLTQTLMEDSAKLSLVVQLLRGRSAFTPIDRQVEDQQGLSGQGRRDRLTILQVPGGQDGPLGQELLKQNVVSDRNQLVDSVEDEIRFLYIRDGLPYAAIKPLKAYKERHDSYLSRQSPITPYTTADAHSYPDIEASKVNLRMYTEGLLYKAKAVLHDLVAQHPSGRCTLRYSKERRNDFQTSEMETFESFEEMAAWLTKHVGPRKALQARLVDTLDANEAEYTSSLVSAWLNATGPERERLLEELYDLGVDPQLLPAA